MSNRPRRRLLRAWRTRALVRAGDSPPDTIQSMKDWNCWHRDALRFLWREPLRFPNNTRPDAGLINMQVRNEAAPFNPLTDPIPELPAHLPESWDLKELWGQIEAAIDGALHYLALSRTITRRRFIPDYGDMYFFEDYPARFYRVFKRLRSGEMSAVHQYGDDGSPWFPDHGSAARNILNLDERITKSWPHRPIKRITEPELYALLVLAACWRALNELRRLPDSWSREDLDYIAGKVQDAERWLAEAYRLKQADTKLAAIRAEEAAKQDAIRADWANDSHRAKSAKGGKAPKGSVGVRLLALKLRNEKPNEPAKTLFGAALDMAGRKAPLIAGGYTITANTDAKLVSIGPDSKPDGRAVDFQGWRAILTLSKGVRLLARALRDENTSASPETLFRAALSRAPHMADSYTITANTEDKLVSTGPDGEPDGLPVGLPLWEKILRRNR